MRGNVCGAEGERRQETPASGNSRRKIVGLLLVLALGMSSGWAKSASAGDAVDVAAGNYHTCAIMASGRAKCWGSNTYGQLGLGHTTDVGDGQIPMQSLGELPLPSYGPIVQLALGGYHTCALDMGGFVWCWGYGADGELGNGSTSNIGDSRGETADTYHALALPGVATKIVAGQFHTCALLVGGRVTCWGYGAYAQLGAIDWSNRGDLSVSFPLVDLGIWTNNRSHFAVDISASAYASCAVVETNNMKCWGYQAGGVLGLETWANQFPDSPRNGPGYPMPAIMGTVPLYWPDSSYQPQVIKVSGGWTHMCAVYPVVTYDVQLPGGQLSDPYNNQMKCWGDNSSGQLGLGDRTTRGDVPYTMGGYLHEVLPAQGTSNGRMNTFFLRAGALHTCVLTPHSDYAAPLGIRAVQCWGDNQVGQLGIGTNGNRGDLTGFTTPSVDLGVNPATGNRLSATRLAAGLYHTCAVLEDATVKCWGDNIYGQLGLDDIKNRGISSTQMGNNLPPAKL